MSRLLETEGGVSVAGKYLGLMRAELPTYHLPPTSSTPCMLFEYVKKGLIDQFFYSLDLGFYD